MKALYNEYLTGAEREAAIIVAESDAQMARLNFLFEAVDATLESNKLAIEAKVLTENGTYDDLTMLYTEAEKEANKNKTGIIATILNAIGSLFERIGNFITSKFGKNLENIPEGNIQVDAGLEKKVNIFKKAWNIIKAPFEKVAAGTEAGLDEEEIKKAWKQIAVEIGAVTATGAAATVITVNRAKIMEWIRTIVNDIKVKVQSGIKKLSTILGVGKIANAAIKNASGKPEGEETVEKKNIGDRLLEFGSFILNKLKEFGGWISHWIGELASKIGLTKKQAEKEATEGAPAEKEVKESVSIFGINADGEDEETFLESELNDEDCNELVEAFAEL